ncbi:type IV secretion system lipoprotein VirB7 [Azospirillum sp. TSO35-2]|uniref:type IV secretion system lipoprotein VirB7 n=1 Tax=Azospirillum sp. TSO35-2 TaxID=716796 RepID=UPI000D6440B2|nr:type IV secretion system lipoprotein VirB7 [Azospirillum sp. TSO35-2]
MILRLTLGLTLLALTACAGHPPLTEPSGPVRPLNAGRWTPTADDLQAASPAGEDGR